jgi:hypothetical protein
MSDSQDTFLDPAEAAAGASRLTHAGEGLHSNLSRIVTQINALNGKAPWGTDETGVKFNEQYLAGEAPAKLVLDASTQLVERVRQLGPDVTAAVEGTVEQDDLVAKWFGGGQRGDS